MKKTIKILLICILVMTTLQCVVLAAGSIDTSIQIGTTPEISSSNAMISRILGFIQPIGSVISLLALVIIGFRYMFSSLEEKAQMKGIIGYYIAGAVLVFATSNILSVAYNIIKDIKY